MEIGIVGSGNVGIGIADALTYLSIGNKITIFNRNLDKAIGEVWDLNDSIPLLGGSMNIRATNDYDDLKECNVIVITAGAKQKPTQTRIDLLNTNQSIIQKIIQNLDKVNPNAIIIIVSNPVDILTRIAIKTSKRDKNKIFGSGTVLDTIRLKEALKEELNINSKNIHAYIVGEHGDSEFPLWSNTQIGPLKLDKFQLNKENIAKNVKTRAYEIIKKKGFTKQAIGISVANIIKAIIYDEKRIFTLSVTLDNLCNCIKGKVCLSIPCVVGKNGIEKKLLMDCNEEEFKLLKKSANKLNKIYKEIK